MKILLKKEVCGSREQCMGPTDRHIPVKILLVKEVVGPMHSAGTHWQTKFHVKRASQLRKKKRKTQTHKCSTKNAIQTGTKLHLSSFYSFTFGLISLKQAFPYCTLSAASGLTLSSQMSEMTKDANLCLYYHVKGCCQTKSSRFIILIFCKNRRYKRKM